MVKWVEGTHSTKLPSGLHTQVMVNIHTHSFISSLPLSSFFLCLPPSFSVSLPPSFSISISLSHVIIIIKLWVHLKLQEGSLFSTFLSSHWNLNYTFSFMCHHRKSHFQGMAFLGFSNYVSTGSQTTQSATERGKEVRWNKTVIKWTLWKPSSIQ